MAANSQQRIEMVKEKTRSAQRSRDLWMMIIYYLNTKSTHIQKKGSHWIKYINGHMRNDKTDPKICKRRFGTKKKTFFQVVDLMRWFMFLCYIFLSSLQVSDCVIHCRMFYGGCCRFWLAGWLHGCMLSLLPQKKYINESTK